jgi:preprotein translocase subunit YajC
MTMLPVFCALLAMGPPPNGQSSAPWYVQLFPLLLMLFAMYFILMMPQRKRAKEHEAMMKALKSGDKITTSGGIVGVVVTVKEKSLSIRSADAKLEILKSAVAEITERAGDTAPAQS